jgi:superfamily II DNA or RNA helicase
MIIAPGAIVEVRTEAWRVLRTERASDGSLVIHVKGVSELVRDREAIFVKELEERRGKITVLTPEATTLVQNNSPGFRASLLHMESLLRQIPPTDNRLHIGHRAAINMLNYQLKPAQITLNKPRQRILIADAVGLGKTLECGILLSELIQRGRGKRILVVAISSMLTQFQKEMWSRFSIPLVRLDSAGLQRIRQRIPTNQNPFYHFDKTIISVDTLKQNNEYRIHLERAHWDVIVIDEAHNVAVRGKNQSQRSALAEMLSHRSDSLIMLSATPHDGKPESFASLMNMLDPTAIANPSEYTPKDIDGLFVRRFKKDIASQVRMSFPEREIRHASSTASDNEEAAFDSLVNLTFKQLDQRSVGGSMLFKTTLEKALLSSPAACLQTIDNRVRNLETHENSANHQHDIAALSNLRNSVGAIGVADFSKYQRLLEILGDHAEFKWTGHKKTDRLVVFTERIETLKFLQENLIRDLGLDPNKVAMLHGGLSDVDQQHIVEQFGQENAPIRLLLASDVASEGINLHYQCHRMIHFDIPWSLMVFRQRNGRIDRYGQTEKPLILYLHTESNNAKLKGDVRVLQLLVTKDQQATMNIGDPSALLGVYDIDAEENITADVIEGRVDAADFEKRLDAAPEEIDLFELMLRHEAPKTEKPISLPSLFASEADYVRTALEELAVPTDADTKAHTVRFEAPDDLLDRFDQFPAEIFPKNGTLELSEDAAVMQEQIVHARTEESSWPNVSYLWPLSPVSGWVNDRMSGLFGRHAAPVIIAPKLKPNELVFVISGMIPNHKSQSQVHEWFDLVFEDGKFQRSESFDDLRQRIGLQSKILVNSGAGIDLSPANALLAQACQEATKLMSERHKAFKVALAPKLDEELTKLAELEERQIAHMNERFDGKTSERDAMAKQIEERRITRVFNEYVNWVTESLTTEDYPFIQVIGVAISK